MSVTPILRMFDVERAKEFYFDYLGFMLDWEHQFEKDFPIYMQISLRDSLLHLSEHHGDCTPGAAVRIEMDKLVDFHKGLHNKNYNYANPGIEQPPWGGKEVTVIDPSGNRLVFYESE